MQSNHTHNECKHEDLKYCVRCDTVEYKTCGREWGGKANYNYINPFYYQFGNGGWTVCTNDTKIIKTCDSLN